MTKNIQFSVGHLMVASNLRPLVPTGFFWAFLLPCYIATFKSSGSKISKMFWNFSVLVWYLFGLDGKMFLYYVWQWFTWLSPLQNKSTTQVIQVLNSASNNFIFVPRRFPFGCGGAMNVQDEFGIYIKHVFLSLSIFLVSFFFLSSSCCSHPVNGQLVKGSTLSDGVW